MLSYAAYVIPILKYGRKFVAICVLVAFASLKCSTPRAFVNPAH